MRQKSVVSLSVALSWILAAAGVLVAQADPPPRGEVWADCELFETFGTPATFDPDHGPFDRIFTGATFLDGVGSIAESRPGDQDFNGGRWSVYQLKEGVPMDKYSGACTVEDLDMDDFEAAEVYFECPLLPKRGRN
jgi:hypothetical protein